MDKVTNSLLGAFYVVTNNCLFQDMNKQLADSGRKALDGAFMRKGQVGNWRQHFTLELEERFKEWEARWLKGCSLKFEYGD